MNHKKIRIAFLTFAYIIDVYQSKLKALQDTGFLDIAWLAPSKWKMYSWNRTMSLSIRYKDVKVYPVNIWFLNGVNGGYLFPTLPLVKVINHFKPDVLHYEQEVFSLSAFQVAVCSKLSRIPFTVFCWENVEKELPVYRWLTTKYVLNNASAIIAGNEEAGQIIKKWGYKGIVEIMPQIGIDTNLFYPREKIEDPHIFTIGYVGRIVQEKGIDLIFDAAKRLIENNIQIRILICGSGDNKQELQIYAEHLGLTKHVHWLGAVNHERVPEILAQLDVLILASRTVEGKWKEQFGHVLVEAMAMGIPVIGSNSGAIPEVIGRPDLIFPENNHLELAQIIKKLIDNPGWKLDISSFLLSRAVSEYSDQRIADRLLELWRGVINQKVKSSNIRVGLGDQNGNNNRSM